MNELLKLLEKNARTSNTELAVLLGKTEQEVADEIARLENDGVIKGYSTLIDYTAINPNLVTAYIELKVTPQARTGFDDIARFISQFDEVKGVTLMSGAFDIGITIIGENLMVVSNFVAQHLATINGVVSTATHFVLKSYKDNGLNLCPDESDERGMF